MNKKLLTDKALRDDLYGQLMFLAGCMAYWDIDGGKVRILVEKQVDMLMPVVKKHIKRRIKAAKGNL
jgi:hypothetical protein